MVCGYRLYPSQLDWHSGYCTLCLRHLVIFQIACWLGKILVSWIGVERRSSTGQNRRFYPYSPSNVCIIHRHCHRTGIHVTKLAGWTIIFTFGITTVPQPGQPRRKTVDQPLRRWISRLHERNRKDISTRRNCKRIYLQQVTWKNQRKSKGAVRTAPFFNLTKPIRLTKSKPILKTLHKNML